MGQFINMGKRLEALIQKPNVQLSKEKLRVIPTREKIYLRATLPPKPGETKWKQRDFSLILPLTKDGVKVAEFKALLQS